jgi:hypothetical protein
MKLRFLYPHWGSEALSCSTYFNVVKEQEFDGIEINIPRDPDFQTAFLKSIQQQRKVNPEFLFVAQQVLGLQQETPHEYLQRALQRLDFIAQFEPNFINSHTGKDHYSFSENCRIIEALEEFSIKRGIPIYHEIHRGRFTFHSTTTLNYLEIFPNLKFVGDFSHWCVVSESLLQDQEDIIEKIAPNIYHLHARVGTEQASQVNHPFAPEWKSHLDRYTDIWKSVLHQHRNKETFSITPEFGPFPYMPQSPFDQQPLSDQHKINQQMKTYLKTALL